MSRFSLDSLRNTHHLRLIIVVPLILAGLLYYLTPVYGALPNRSIKLSDSTPGALSSMTLGMDFSSAQVVGSIKLELCSNSPLPGVVCTLPPDVDLRNVTLTGQNGETGFTLKPSSFFNTIVLTRTPAVTSSINASFTFDNFTNPSNTGTYFARLETFSNANAAAPDNSFGGLAFNINNTLQVSATVPPYLLFCTGVTITGFDCNTASGDYINFGNFLPTSTKTATTEMVTATNAGGGFNISVNGPTLISGNNTIPAIATQDVSRPGTSQFGLNVVANATPAVGSNPQGTGLATVAPGYNIADRYRYASGDTIVTRSDSDEYRKFTVSYIVNIAKDQPVGVYVTTLSYICLANF